MGVVTITDIIAIIFDFDDTLVPDSLTALLSSASIDTKDFWEAKVPKLIQEGYDPPSAYLKLLLDNIGDGKPLGPLTNAKLRQFGETLDSQFFPGLPKFFEDVPALVKAEYKNIEVEFYIISGGLQAILEGSKIVRKYFKGAYGCQLAGDTEDGVLKYVRRSVTFTEKTRYLFEINKGVDQRESSTNPYLVNAAKEPKDRRIPFPNVIYLGDGLTDIPCFSTVQLFGGKAFGVFNPTDRDKAKQAFEKMLIPHRVISTHSPRYSEDDDLGSLLRAATIKICLDIEVGRKTAIR